MLAPKFEIQSVILIQFVEIGLWTEQERRERNSVIYKSKCLEVTILFSLTAGCIT